MPTTLRVTLPDPSMDKLYERTKFAPGGDLELTASKVLMAGLTMLPAEGGRVVVLTGDDLRALEELLGGGSILNSPDLRQKVERLAGISFQHVRLQFTPSQLEQVQEKARRQNKSVEQLVDQMAPRIHEQFFGLIDQRG